MENLYEAFIMGGSVLLFIIALTVGVYSYTRVLNVNNKILTRSEYYDQAAEGIEETDFGKTYIRVFSPEEVVNQIISLFENRDFVFNRIIVHAGSNTYTYTTPAVDSKGGDGLSISKNAQLRAIMNAAPNGYYAKYTFESKTVEYYIYTI